MNALSLIWIVALGGATIICIIGSMKKKIGVVTLGAVLAIIIGLSSIYVHTSPARIHTYRVAYAKEEVVVLIDDENGKTKRYNINSIPHANTAYEVGDNVVVVDDGARTVYIAPAEQVAPVENTETNE